MDKPADRIVHRYCGVMTGTSMDAIDVSLVDISERDGSPRLDVLVNTSSPYPSHLLSLIHSVLDPSSCTIQHVSACNALLADAYASAVSYTLGQAGVNPDTVVALGVHGQTMWHEPSNRNDVVSHTLQLLSIPRLAATLGIRTVGDFRTADVALGGQGAPLVSTFDRDFFHNESEDRVLLNIGGMANITCLPSKRSGLPVRAFDTGPGNILIDEAMRLGFGKSFDKNGSTAYAGRVSQFITRLLRSDEFVAAPPPKSTGRERYNRAFLEELIADHLHPGVPYEDLVATLTDFTAWSIAENITSQQPRTSRIIASGGGVHNAFLFERLRSYLPGIELESISEHGIDPDYKEAICFAYLAWLFDRKIPGNIPSVTGASKPVVLGVST